MLKLLHYIMRPEIYKLAQKFEKDQYLSLGKNVRSEANDDLIQAGMDGNGRFKSVGLALSMACKVLEKYNIEPNQVFSAWEFKKPKGISSIELAFSNPGDPFSPMPIINSNLYFSWYELMPDKYEVVAYLS